MTSILVPARHPHPPGADAPGPSLSRSSAGEGIFALPSDLPLLRFEAGEGRGEGMHALGD
jgi:hypothetical protein